MPPVQPDKKERARINRRARRSKIRQNASNTIPTPGPSGGGAVPNVTAAPRRNNNGGGGGGGGNGGGGGLGGSTNTVPNPEPVDTLKPQNSIWDNVPGAQYEQYRLDPSLAASKWLQNQGYDTTHAGGVTKLISDLAAFAPQLFYLTQGGTDNPQQAGNAAYMDFVDNFLTQYTTPGGGTIDPLMVGNTLFGGDNISEGSALDALLNAPGMSTAAQINALLGFASAGLSTSMGDTVTNALMSVLDQEARDWQANMKLDPNNPDGTLTEYLKNTPTGRYMRGGM